MKSLITWITTSLLCATSLAQDAASLPPVGTRDVGTRGGGNVVVCFHKPLGELGIAARNERGELINVYLEREYRGQPLSTLIKSIEAFDLYLARLKAESRPDLYRLLHAEENESPEAYVARVLDKYSMFPALKENFARAQKAIPISAMTLFPHGVSPQADFRTVGQIDTTYCVLTSIVVQEKTENASDLSGDKRLWEPENPNVLAPSTRQVINLHELAYWIDREVMNAGTSEKTAKVVVELILERKGQTYEEFANRLHSLNFPIFATSGAPQSWRDFAKRRFLTLSRAITAKALELRKPHPRTAEARLKDFLMGQGTTKKPRVVRKKVSFSWFNGFSQGLAEVHLQEIVRAVNYVAWDIKSNFKNCDQSRVKCLNDYSSLKIFMNRDDLPFPEQEAEWKTLISDLVLEESLDHDRQHPDWNGLRTAVMQFYLDQIQPQIYAFKDISQNSKGVWNRFFEAEIQSGFPAVDRDWADCLERWSGALIERDQIQDNYPDIESAVIAE